MVEIARILFTIPPAVGVTFALLILALLIQKEIARALGRPGWMQPAGDPDTARPWRRVENWFIGLLFGVYGFILLARLLSFFP